MLTGVSCYSPFVRYSWRIWWHYDFIRRGFYSDILIVGSHEMLSDLLRYWPSHKLSRWWRDLLMTHSWWRCDWCSIDTEAHSAGNAILRLSRDIIWKSRDEVFSHSHKLFWLSSLLIIYSVKVMWYLKAIINVCNSEISARSRPEARNAAQKKCGVNDVKICNIKCEKIMKTKWQPVAHIMSAVS